MKRELARHVPERPAPLVDTASEIAPHYTPPFSSKEEHRRWKAWEGAR